MSMQVAHGVRPSFTMGDRLRKARSVLGADMDVKRFADLIGVSKNTVTNYELENTVPERMKPIVLRQWSLATGVDYEWLVNGETPPTGGGVSGGWLPGLDSNQEPAGFKPIVQLAAMRRAA